MATQEKNVIKKYDQGDHPGALKNSNQDKTPVDRIFGPTLLSRQEENLVVHWIMHLNATGFSINKDQLLNSVQKFLMDLKRQTPFRNDKSTKHWYQDFLKHHPKLALKMSQNEPQIQTEVSEGGISEWYRNIETYLLLKGLLKISGARIFNCSELSFLLNPKSEEVLVPKNKKCAYSYIPSDEKDCVTVLMTGNAEGQMVPPMILYNYEKIPASISDTVPSAWFTGSSKSSWMIQESFHEYITGNFYKWCVENNIEFPIILYLDGHFSHFSMTLNDFCIEHQIELIPLHSNVTHLINPMDAALFRPLKLFWSAAVTAWRLNNNEMYVDETSFAPSLKEALNTLDLKKLISDEFKNAGLHPFSLDAIVHINLIKSRSIEVD